MIVKQNEQNKLLKYSIEDELTEIYLKSDVILLDDVFQKDIKVSIKEFDNNPVFVSVYIVILISVEWNRMVLLYKRFEIKIWF